MFFLHSFLAAKVNAGMFKLLNYVTFYECLYKVFIHVNNLPPTFYAQTDSIAKELVSSMEALKTYLETSTIHGLTYIGSSKSYVVRLLWTIVVASSFTVAVVLIRHSFSSWEESPYISTTTTLSIASVVFPKVTVCPPDGTNTILNYDIENSKKIILNETFRNSLIEIAKVTITKRYHRKFVKDVKSFTSAPHIIDMYNGKAKFSLPFKIENNRFFTFESSNASGTITSPWFGKEYSESRFDTHTLYSYTIRSSHDQLIDINLKNFSIRILPGERDR